MTSLGVLYLVTLCPTIYSGDAAELATAGATFGIAHPPGYPLYSLLANAWVRLLAVGDVAWRLNVLSAVAASGAALLLFRFLARMGISVPAALFSALGLGVGLTFWSQALISEVYALDMLLAALSLWAAARARQLKTTGAVVAALACVGLWIGHRTVNLVYAPAALIIAWPAIRTMLRSGGRIALSLAALAAPGLLLLYLPVASSCNPLLDTGDPQTWPRFWKMVTAAYYRHYLVGPTLSNLGHVIGGLPRELGLALLAAPVGVAIGWRRRQQSRTLVVARAYLALTSISFAASYAVPDVSVFVLPAILALFALAGAGLTRVADARVTWTLLIVSVAAMIAWNLPRNDLRGQTLARDFARDALAYAGQRAIVLSHVDTVSFSLWYAQAVERRRRDLLVVSRGRAVDWHQEQARRLRPDLSIPLYDGPDQASRWPALLVEQNSGRAAVYLTANLLGYFAPVDASRLARRFEEVPAGLMMQLAPRGTVNAATAVERNETFWQRAWPHATRARSQKLGTELTAVLLHYASMRVLFARFSLWHGEAEAARRAARAVVDLDTGPLVAAVNAEYLRQGKRYHMSDMPRQAEGLAQLAGQLAAGSISAAHVRRLLDQRPRPIPPPRPGEAAGPGSVAALNQRGIELAKAGQLVAALAVFDRVLQRMPQHHGALFNRAKVLAMLGRTEDAARAYEALLALSPDSLAGLIGLAELRRQSDPAAAVKLFRRALRADGPEQLKQLARQRIAEIEGREP